MFNKSSIYLLNKRDPDAIVYPSATGEIVRITREDFPSEEEFLAFKKWSDENFHKEDNRDVVEDKHRISIDGLSEAALAVPSDDVIMERRQLRAEKRKVASDLVVKFKGKLTETQFRRLWMHEVEGKTLEEIAALENVAFQSVHESIEGAKKKILKKFKKTP